MSTSVRRISFLLTLVLILACIPSCLADAVKYEAPKQIVITFTGDCTLGIDDRERGKATGFDAFIQQYGIDYPFEKVRDIFAQDDLTVINLEGTLYNSDVGRANKTYARYNLCGNTPRVTPGKAHILRHNGKHHSPHTN